MLKRIKSIYKVFFVLILSSLVSLAVFLPGFLDAQQEKTVRLIYKVNPDKNINGYEWTTLENFIKKKLIFLGYNLEVDNFCIKNLKKPCVEKKIFEATIFDKEKQKVLFTETGTLLKIFESEEVLKDTLKKGRLCQPEWDEGVVAVLETEENPMIKINRIVKISQKEKGLIKQIQLDTIGLDQ